PGIGDALVFQPGIQFGQALHPWLRAEQQIAQVANLVLDLFLLPSRGRRAGATPAARLLGGLRHFEMVSRSATENTTSSKAARQFRMLFRNSRVRILR